MAVITPPDVDEPKFEPVLLLEFVLTLELDPNVQVVPKITYPG